MRMCHTYTHLYENLPHVYVTQINQRLKRVNVFW